jgi:hypothetical protein
MRPRTAFALVVGFALAAAAQSSAATCPPDCFSGGGGPRATDCFLQWSGLTATSLTCADGDPACDLDGKLDGVCTMNVSACINMPDASGACVTPTLSAPPKASGKGVTAFRSALAALDPAAPGCTTGGLTTTLKVKAGGIKPVVMRVKTTAVSGGKKDTDNVRLTCTAGRPTLAAVQPIFTAKCATLGCHTDSTRSGDLTLTAGKARTAMLDVRATASPRWILLKAGNPRKSFLVRKLFPLPALLGSPMPQGCRITNTCLTPEELATIVAWVQAGAPE